MEILDQEEEHSDDEGEADFDGDEDLEVGGEGGALLEESFVIDQTCADMLELDILPRETSIGIEGGVSAVCRLAIHPALVSTPQRSPFNDNVEVFVWSCSWTTTLCPSSLCSKVVSPQVVTNYHVFTRNIGGATNIWNNAWSRLSS